MSRKDLISLPQVQWGMQIVNELLQKQRNNSSIILKNAKVELPGRFVEEGFAIALEDNDIKIQAATPNGFLYALLDIAQKLRISDKLPDRWSDAPWMRFRGYTLGLQKENSFYPDHKYYDWPISREHFPWFYDREHLKRVLDILAFQRCNMLTLWSSHPFSSFLKLEEYPEMAEVEEEQLAENQKQLSWLIEEAEKRGIQIFFHIYNIHMPDPLAKARNWDVMSGLAHDEINTYTKKTLKAFVEKYPKIGFVICMGEVIKKSEQKKWLQNVLLKGILDGLGKNPLQHPPLILREHGFDLTANYAEAKEIYPNLHTMMKHNSENLISTRSAPENISIRKISNTHLINVHLCSNLEPFSWGSPCFIRETVEQMVRQSISGVLVFPLRFWDWPNSAHVNSAGDQLYEHFIWWNAWGRYAWNPWREEKEEEEYWVRLLKEHYGLSEKASEAMLAALEETGEVLPEISSQFLISSGNRQNVNLGQFIVPLAFTRILYKGGSGYSMSQQCGFPVIDEQMWSISPIERMNVQIEKCRTALKILETHRDTPFIDLIYSEIQALLLIAEFYKSKAQACTEYFQLLYGVESANETKALSHLEKSLNIYHKLVEKTVSLFRDAGSLKVHRTLPLPAEEGFIHWKECLDAFEQELQVAQTGGIHSLLKFDKKSI